MRHYPDLGSASDWPCRVGNLFQPIRSTTDVSSVWNFCTHFSDVIWRGNRWQSRQMSAVFSGYILSQVVLFILTLSLLLLAKEKIHKNIQIELCNILRERPHCAKVLPKQFHLNGNTIQHFVDRFKSYFFSFSCGCVAGKL